MSGGIIIQRAKVLVTAATDPSLYNNLPQHCKDQVDAIEAKDPASRTQADCVTLASIITVGVHC
jgi:hypothetical protein